MRRVRIAASLVGIIATGVACGGTDDNPTGTSAPGSDAAAAATIATIASSTQPALATTPTTAAPLTYTVAAGDSLFAIAQRLCTDLDTLVATNAWPDGVEHPIFPGDVIAVPGSGCDAATAVVTAQAETTVSATGTLAACATAPCTFPYGDPADATSVYEPGPCAEIRAALQQVAIGPAAARPFEDAAFGDGPAPPPIDADRIRGDAVALWSAVIDAYGGMGDVPEGVTTSLGRAGPIEGDVAVAYVNLLTLATTAPGAVPAGWDAAYAALRDAITARTANGEPILADLDARCPASGP